MDRTTERLVEYIHDSSFGALSADVTSAAKLRLIDAIGCAIGAFDEPLSVMARNVASRTSSDPPARIWGSRATSSPELAAFANGVMVRVMDISDTYLGKARGHPSDMMSGILAAAECVHADGASVLNAVTLAYDVYCSFCDAIDWNSNGWDQPVYAVLGCVAGVGKLLGLDDEQLSNAISLALVPNMALAQTRRGPLSSWKGCAGANASRNAVFAAMLGREGFTGPTAIFEGDGGIFDVIGAFDWQLPAGRHLITETHVKSLPVCYHGQSAVLCALDMRNRIAARDIVEIRVDTYHAAHNMMGNDPSRWAPTTHETADHSLPYTVAIAFLDGAVTEASYDSRRFTDPAVVGLMQKVKVHEDAGLTAKYPAASPSRLTVKTADGQAHTLEMIYPLGHAMNPMSADDIEAKFHRMLAGRYSRAQSAQILERLSAAEAARDFARDILGLLDVGH
jgi:2-methylcitrate dehydratase